jgi:microcystin-dependent protein
MSTKAKQTRVWAKTMALVLLVAGSFALSAAWLARADGIPPEPTMYYAGTLEEGGEPVTGTRDIRLTLWDDEFSEEVTNRLCRVVPASDTMVDNGRFRIPLEDEGDCTDGIRQNREVWVEVLVEGTSLGRSRVGAVPYAVESERSDNGSPPGTVIAFAGEAVPPGWLVCDGRALSSADYPELFAAIRTAWGNGTSDTDPATDFNLPDLRGRFLRGLDDGAGRDPDAASRTASALGGNSGDRVGTVQDGELASHTHPIRDPGHRHTMRWRQLPLVGNSAQERSNGDAGDPRPRTDLATTGIEVLAAGGSETRPLNAAVNYIIKY